MQGIPFHNKTKFTISTLFLLCVGKMVMQFINAYICFQGVSLAGLDWAVESHVTVLARPHVTHLPGGASVPQEGRDRDVKKVNRLVSLTCNRLQRSHKSVFFVVLNTFCFENSPFPVSDCGGERFGPDCSLPCQCSHRARCEGLSGRCLCPLTWLGPTCTEGKPLSDFVVFPLLRKTSHWFTVNS